MNHTPWRVETSLPYPRIVYGPVSDHGFSDDLPMTVETLEEIVEACNAHDRLVSENARLREALTRISLTVDHAPDNVQRDLLGQCITIARTALGEEER